MAKIGIVGGGISGLAAALALTRTDHDVELFERAPELKEVGSGLTLWSNATRVLRELDVLDRCLKSSQVIHTFCLRLASGRTVMTIPIEPFSTTAVAMHRADLQSALFEAIPPGIIQTNHTCSGVRDEAGKTFLVFDKGSCGPFDLILGADGLRSTLRSLVVNDDLPSYRGYYVWRGVASLALSDYPEGQISESWGRGERFGILPMGGGRVCWYATANLPLAPPTPPKERQTKLLRQFSGWHTPIIDLIRATPPLSILENPAFDRAPRRGWNRGNILLIGDAAHPLTPNLGQGACMALEDAMVLSKMLATAEQSSSLSSVVAAYEAERFRRIEAMVRRCRWLGALGQWQRPAIASLRNVLAARMPGSFFTYTSRAIQSYQADRVFFKKSRVPPAISARLG